MPRIRTVIPRVVCESWEPVGLLLGTVRMTDSPVRKWSYEHPCLRRPHRQQAQAVASSTPQVSPTMGPTSELELSD